MGTPKPWNSAAFISTVTLAICFLLYFFGNRSESAFQIIDLTAGPRCVAVQDFPGTIILSRPTGNEITFSILSNSDIPQLYIAAESQEAPPTQTGAFALAAGVPSTITLSGLAPNSYYYYTAVMNVEGNYVCSTMHGFQTPRYPGSSFKFSIMADSHLGSGFLCNEERYKQSLSNINSERPDFTISIGDDFLADLPWVIGEPEVQKLYLAQRPYYAEVAQDGALFNINGNHELQSGWLLDGTDKNMAIRVIRARLALYPNPRPNYFYSGSSTPQPLVPGELTENYYAWFWGDAMLVALDDYLYSGEGKQWSWSLGYEQFSWLKNVLQFDAGFKFVLHHSAYSIARGGVEGASYYEWGGLGDKEYEFTTMRPGWGDQPIHQILVANQVDIIFKGHDHLYAKQDHADGIIYVTVPQVAFDPDGWKGGNNDKSAEYNIGTVLGPAGHISVEVTPDVATVSYILSRIPTDSLKNGVNGQVAHQFVVPRKMRV